MMARSCNPNSGGGFNDLFGYRTRTGMNPSLIVGKLEAVFVLIEDFDFDMKHMFYVSIFLHLTLLSLKHWVRVFSTQQVPKHEMKVRGL